MLANSLGYADYRHGTGVRLRSDQTRKQVDVQKEGNVQSGGTGEAVNQKSHVYPPRYSLFLSRTSAVFSEGVSIPALISFCSQKRRKTQAQARQQQRRDGEAVGRNESQREEPQRV